MIGKIFAAGERRNAQAFWLGTVIVTAGVLLHVPMFLMARQMGYRMAGMPMDAGMIWGMWLIIGGVALAAWGLLPKTHPDASRVIERIAPPEDAPLTRTHWWIASLLCLALIIDIMKPASLGFVTPGMRAEYGVDGATVAWLPLSALVGTAIGSFAWGVLADIYGRRASILLSSVLFVGTSICGAMPGFWWNVFMCWLMGLAAGGMLPVTYALLAEIMPTRHRGWSLVLIGGIGAVGGFFAASALSALLQPLFGWRIMWFLNLPTGLILIALSPLLPESARFLQQMGRGAEAREMAARFGATVVHDKPASTAIENSPMTTTLPQIGITVALTLAALAWSLVNFGLLLWLPGELVEEGRSVGTASALIAESTLLAAPVILFSTWLYSRWSTKGSLILMLAFMSAGLLGLLARSSGIGWLENPLVSLTILVIGSCGVIAILLPYAAENYALRVRGRATGWVAGCSKLGGVLAQVLAVLGVVPAFGKAALVIVVPSVISLILIALWGRETRGSDLRSLDPHLGSTT
ncbi:MAG: MFS transporter [Gammaproteobacteria bacterium]|nr:MFS transporter [Gammaproteobacteria bacterium]MDH5303856.1 MFS transporter [Gammaproteobacteria bacterium]MDH5321459.1 MFS transporter [Gammaproteobacteria bacterium]